MKWRISRVDGITYHHADWQKLTVPTYGVAWNAGYMATVAAEEGARVAHEENPEAKTFWIEVRMDVGREQGGELRFTVRVDVEIKHTYKATVE